MESINRDFYDFEPSFSFRTLGLVHFIINFAEDTASFTFVGGILGFVSGIPIILDTGGFNIMTNMILHVIIVVFVSIIFVYIISYSDYRFTDVELKDGYMRWYEQNNENKIKISNIEDIKSEFLRVKIETKKKEEVIWTPRPDKIKNSVIARTI